LVSFFTLKTLRSFTLAHPERRPRSPTGYAVLKKTAAKAKEEGFCRRIFTLLPEDLRPEGLQPEDRFCDPKGAFQNSVPPKAIDPLYVKAGKPCQRLKGANKK
jgi:hypothetical protein